MSSVGCGTTNDQCSTFPVSTAGVITSIGILASAAACAICTAEGTPFEPSSTSALSSEISLRAFFAALVGSEASSRMMKRTGSPPRVLPISWKALR